MKHVKTIAFEKVLVAVSVIYGLYKELVEQQLKHQSLFKMSYVTCMDRSRRKCVQSFVQAKLHRQQEVSFMLSLTLVKDHVTEKIQYDIYNHVALRVILASNVIHCYHTVSSWHLFYYFLFRDDCFYKPTPRSVQAPWLCDRLTLFFLTDD